MVSAVYRHCRCLDMSKNLAAAYGAVPLHRSFRPLPGEGALLLDTERPPAFVFCWAAGIAPLGRGRGVMTKMSFDQALYGPRRPVIVRRLRLWRATVGNNDDDYEHGSCHMNRCVAYTF